ncbi:MAG: hypothetical protein DRJ56_04525 [Thermoprotei archaeon]|nr:MAG: hypothetical protein DRJ56_04525 [Thermoprotei archaeon]
MPRRPKVHSEIPGAAEYEEALRDFFTRPDCLYVLDVLLLLRSVKYAVAEKLYAESRLYRSAVDYLRGRRLVAVHPGDRASVLYLTQLGREAADSLAKLLELIAGGEGHVADQPG